VYKHYLIGFVESPLSKAYILGLNEHDGLQVWVSGSV